METIRLKLQKEQQELSHLLGDGHPSVSALKRRIENLSQDPNNSGPPKQTSQDTSTALEDVRTKLTIEYETLRKRLGEDHPDVLIVKRQLENLPAPKMTTNAAFDFSFPGPFPTTTLREQKWESAQWESTKETRGGIQAQQALKVRPKYASLQRDFDEIEFEQIANSILQTGNQGSASGFRLYTRDWTLVRAFMDTNNDKTIDQWIYYRNGKEVYRDVDANFDARADFCVVTREVVSAGESIVERRKGTFKDSYNSQKMSQAKQTFVDSWIDSRTTTSTLDTTKVLVAKGFATEEQLILAERKSQIAFDKLRSAQKNLDQIILSQSGISWERVVPRKRQ